MEWSEFAQRLGRELAGLDRDTILIVRERAESRHYVQAMREPDRLYAEAVSNYFLDGPLLLTAADEEVLSEAGWKPPGDPAPRNWWTELTALATAADHFRLADMMVHALRDVQGVRRPSDLVYESFHRLGNGLIELVDFGIAPADPSRVTERRSTPDPVSPQQPVAGPVLSAPVGEPVPDALPPAANGVARGTHHRPGPATPVPTLPPAPAPAPAPVPGPGPGLRTEPDDGELEHRLAEAKRQGDHVTYFDLLLRSDLVLPLPEEPGAPEPVTATIAGTVHVLVFSSPAAMAASLKAAVPPPHRRVPFGALAAAWPDPSWSLAVNAGLPSEVILDAVAVARLDHTRRTAEQAAAVDAISAAPVPPSPADTARPQDAGPATGLVPPNGTPPANHATSPLTALPADFQPPHDAVPDAHTPPPAAPHPAAPVDHLAPPADSAAPAHAVPAMDAPPHPVPPAGHAPAPPAAPAVDPGTPHSTPAADVPPPHAVGASAAPPHAPAPADALLPPHGAAPDAHAAPPLTDQAALSSVTAPAGTPMPPHDAVPDAIPHPAPTGAPTPRDAAPDAHGMPYPADQAGPSSVTAPAGTPMPPHDAAPSPAVPHATGQAAPASAPAGASMPHDAAPYPADQSAPSSTTAPAGIPVPPHEAALDAVPHPTGPAAGAAVPPHGAVPNASSSTTPPAGTAMPPQADAGAAGPVADPSAGPPPAPGGASPVEPPAELPRRRRRRSGKPSPTGPAAAERAGTPPGDAVPASVEGRTAIRLPHGVRLWEDRDGGEPRPLAVYDAISGGWTRVRVDASDGSGRQR